MRALKKRYVVKENGGRNPADFRAVAIVSGLEGCCTEAKRLGDERFLARDAPPLPLTGCDASECGCRYEKYADRRFAPRRGGEMGITSTFVRDKERRTKRKGRRSSDP